MNSLLKRCTSRCHPLLTRTLHAPDRLSVLHLCTVKHVGAQQGSEATRASFSPERTLKPDIEHFAEKAARSADKIELHRLIKEHSTLTPEIVDKFTRVYGIPVDLSWDELVKQAADKLTANSTLGWSSVLPTDWQRCAKKFQLVMGDSKRKLVWSLWRALLAEAGERRNADVVRRLITSGFGDVVFKLDEMQHDVMALHEKLRRTRPSDAEHVMDAYLRALKELDVYVPTEVTTGIYDGFDSTGIKELTASFVHVDVSGRCPKCCQCLEEADLTDSKTTELKSAMLTDIVEEDEFFQQFPQGINDLINFVESASYHYVIDIKSVCSKRGHQQFRSLIEHITEKEKKTAIVVGKKEDFLSHSNFKNNFWLDTKVDTVAVPKKSTSIHYMLVALMHSSSEANYIMDGDLKDLQQWLNEKPYASQLKTWLRKRRGAFEYDKHSMQWLPVLQPTYATVVQRSAATIHIPCSSGDVEQFSLNLPASWFCLKMS